MSYKYFNANVLGFQGNFIISCKKIENTREFSIEQERKKCKCPKCGCHTDKIHDYRIQKVKDLDCFECKTVLMVKKRRYTCQKCNKHFYEEWSFLRKYARMTDRLVSEILTSLGETVSFKHVAKQYGVSVTTVIRVFDKVNYPKPNLPNTVSIDEFKGNTGGQKYNCIIADPLKHKVLDIIPDRQESAVLDYFIRYSKEERNRVDIFVSDMWRPYQNTAKTVFKNATCAIDKYHWIRQVTWAFERVRKDAQKHMSVAKRKYFKHSRKLLLAPFNSLTDDDKQAVLVMLDYGGANLSTAHYFKEEFQKIAKYNRVVAKKEMDDWIRFASECGVSAIESCAKTMLNWKKEILNSYNTSCTNGFIEGCNNKIKVLKRVSYGYKNFRRFRNRILYIFSNNI